MSQIVVPSTLRERLEELAGRRRQVWLVAAVIVVAVLVALTLERRSQPKIAPPAEAPLVAPPVVTSPSPMASAVPTGQVILVHVAGAVNRPGLYEMPAGARIADAIDLARGPKPSADLGALNLAEPLSDGQKIDVPRRGEDLETVAPTTPGTAPTPGAAPTAATVDLNTADQATLETIPGVGPVTAQAIITYRTEVGAFESIDQLLEVSGIGPATLESIRPYVTI
ncbi:MAG: helix-hairpin-helix domain-containing protein [Actinomycetota bacterium]|nr:helix-hairpin-helix domain-containing protein [Actinomycetota bacterium]